ncbi:hypothetical protein [Chitinophaga sp. YIM B06452]|uniref:hypothetical protein n=1 Tax=Chitinophaga sp. YIM B06452 TaxID=3082158 RepID=UPI0031FF3183
MEKKIKFAPRDAKIIKENPTLSPYQLLELGISKPAFEKLMEQPTTDINPEADTSLELEEMPATSAVTEIPADKEPVQKETLEVGSGGLPVLTPKLTGEMIAGPVQKAVSRRSRLEPGQVMVQTPNGIQNPMGREFAQKLIKQDPRYKII